MDEVELGVGPVELLLAVVQRESVGPVYLLLDDHGTVGAVHARPLDLRDLPPVGPVHVPGRANGGGETVKTSISFIFRIHAVTERNG